MTEPALVEPLAYSIRQCAAALSVSERQIYILAERNGLPTCKIGGRRLIRVADLRAWLAAQPADGQGEKP
jgi:excisionase family DNA binding protein